METGKIRIKDIAERAGVSVGTVDRVLHERPNVSPKALAKVKKALEEMDYKPNRFASALAYNKSYTFFMVLPKHESEAYWEEIEEGASTACDRLRDFSISVKIQYYNRFDTTTFSKTMTDILKQEPDGVVIVPSQLDITRKYTDIMHDQQVPFILLDSYMPDLRPLAFFGQDSFSSGYFAARMLMIIASKEKEIMLMKQMRNGNVASKQQENRETGFRHYMHDHFPNVSTCRSTRSARAMMPSWRSSSRSILRCTTASPSIPRLTWWVNSCSEAIAGTSRLWVTTWFPRMRSACAKAAYRSSLRSMLSCRVTPVSTRSSMPSS